MKLFREKEGVRRIRGSIPFKHAAILEMVQLYTFVSINFLLSFLRFTDFQTLTPSEAIYPEEFFFTSRLEFFYIVDEQLLFHCIFIRKSLLAQTCLTFA